MKEKLKNVKEDQRGIAILIVVLVLGAVILLLSMTLGLGSISENQISLYQGQATEMFINADGCAEEALTKINSDNNYVGGNLTIGATSCTITVSGNGNTRTIDINATKNNYSKFLQLTVNLSPTFSVSTWQELNN